MTPEQRIATAVRDAQVVLSAYVEPGFRDPERTINELFNVLDDCQLIDALEKFENGQPREEGSAGSQSDKPERRLRGEVLDKAPWG